MFHGIRRFKQQLPGTGVIQILKNKKTAVLGVSGGDGCPYTVSIDCVYTGGKTYFHQVKSNHKYNSVKQCGKVSFYVIERDDVVAEEFTTYYKSVIMFDKVKILGGNEGIFHAAQVLSLKYYNDQDVVERETQKAWKAFSCVRVTTEHMTGKEAIEPTHMGTGEGQS